MYSETTFWKTVYIFVDVLLNFQSTPLCLGLYMTSMSRLWLILLTIHRCFLLVCQSSFHNNLASFVDWMVVWWVLNISLKFPWYTQWPLPERRYASHCIVWYDAIFQFCNDYHRILHAHVLTSFNLQMSQLQWLLNPVLHRLLANQKVNRPDRIDWQKVSCICSW